MELSIKDRLYLPTFLPAKGNFKDFNLKKEIMRKIAISDDERKEINFRENQEDNRLEWDVEKETPLIVDFSKAVRARRSQTRSCLTICGQR